MVEADAAGLDVVRLCSGDPAVFSAVAEQARRLDRAGIGYDITPGVPAFAAAAAALSRELTVPGVGQTVVLTRIAQRATPDAARGGPGQPSLGATGATLVLHLAVQRIEQVVAELTPHYGPDCPAAVVAYASQPGEVVLRGTLGDIAAQVLAAGVKRTAVIIVGRVLAAEGFRDSHLYSAARTARPTLIIARPKLVLVAPPPPLLIAAAQQVGIHDPAVPGPQLGPGRGDLLGHLGQRSADQRLVRRAEVGAPEHGQRRIVEPAPR